MMTTARKQLEALIAKAQDVSIRVEAQGPEHADLKIIPRGHLALLAWGQNTEHDARLIAWLWNHRQSILELYEADEANSTGPAPSR